MRKELSRVLALLVGLVVGGVGYILSWDPLIAPTLVVVYGLGALLTFEYYDELPDGARGGENWEVTKWNGILVGVVTSGAFVTMNSVSEVPLDVGFTQALVLYGVGWVGYFVAVAQFDAARKTEAGTATSA